MEPANPKPLVERVKSKDHKLSHPDQPIDGQHEKPRYETPKMRWKNLYKLEQRKKDEEAVIQRSKPEVEVQNQVTVAIDVSVGEAGQDPSSSVTGAGMEKSRKAAVKAGKQPIGKRLSKGNAKSNHANAFRSMRDLVTAAYPKPLRSRQLSEAPKHPAERAIEVSEPNLNSVRTLDEKLKRWKKLHVHEHNNAENSATVEEFLRVMLRFPPKINPSGRSIDQAAKNKSDSPSSTSSGHHAA